MKNFFLLVLIVCSFTLYSQVVADKKTVVFGEIYDQGECVYDITLENRGQKEALLLRTGFTPEYDWRIADKTIPVSGKTTLRVQYNPRQEGSFRDEVTLWFSTMQKPVTLTFKGEAMFALGGYPSCPDFNTRPTGGVEEFGATIKVINARNYEPIRQARVRLVQNGLVEQSLRTNRNGEVSLDVPIAYYLMLADHEDFFPNDTANYINRRNYYFEIALDPREIELQEDEYVESIEVFELTPTEMEVTEEVSIRIDFKKEEPEPKEEPAIADTSEELPESKFGRNNIVFLVDVSHSMAQKGKMELLQASMLELTGVLRAVDQVALITYASNPETKLESTQGNQHNEIQAIVMDLEARGMTSGAKGFKAAYDMANDHMIDGGNNEVIVCTDGAFRTADNPRIMKMVKKYRRRGIKTTVVGIRSNSHASEQLTEIAQLGQGSFISLTNFDLGREMLIDEIKKQSRK